jgi:hypothetical protein
VRVEPTNNEITDIRIDGINSPQGIAIGEDAVWVSDIKKESGLQD